MFTSISYRAGAKAAVTSLSLLVLGACQTMAPGTTAAQRDGYFTTSDNVRLHYIEAGKGKPLVLIPGWSQTAAQFKHQISDLSADYRVIAIDMRGHGESPNRTTAIAFTGFPLTCTSSWLPRGCAM